MTPEQAKQLEDTAWLVYNTVIPTLNEVKGQTDTINPPLQNVDWLTYHGVMPALTDLSARLYAIEGALGLESDPAAIPTEAPTQERTGR